MLKERKLLKAVHKRLEIEETSKYTAENGETTEMRTQQECILSGGVYLRHRLKDNLLPFLLLNYSITTGGVQSAACRRAGVQEAVPLFD